jgi:RNA polymerase sigma-70 factor (ECF subfamily)
MENIFDVNDINMVYMKQVFRYVLHHVHHYDLAEDLTQQTFLKVWECRTNLDPNKSIIPYLYKTALNEIKMHYRDEETTDSLSSYLELVEPKTVPDVEKELLDIMLIELSRMSPFQQELITLHFMDQMGFGEISKIVGKSIIATRVAFHRALQLLQKNITEATKE